MNAAARDEAGPGCSDLAYQAALAARAGRAGRAVDTDTDTDTDTDERAELVDRRAAALRAVELRLASVSDEELTPRAASAEAHAARIVETARVLFEERGFAGVTMDDVAAEARCSRRTVYRAGRGRVDLLLAAGRRIDDIPLPWREVRARLGRGELVGAGLAERHARGAAIELVIRGVAATGVPRARAFVAQLDLTRHEEALALMSLLVARVPDARV